MLSMSVSVLSVVEIVNLDYTSIIIFYRKFPIPHTLKFKPLSAKFGKPKSQANPLRTPALQRLGVFPEMSFWFWNRNKHVEKK